MHDIIELNTYKQTIRLSLSRFVYWPDISVDGWFYLNIDRYTIRNVDRLFNWNIDRRSWSSVNVRVEYAH